MEEFQPESVALKKNPFSFFEYHRIDAGGRVKIPNEVHEKEKWLVLEKVHGSNFSFYCDGSTISCSRRNSMLDDVETFFGWQAVRDKYRNSIFQVFHEIQKSIHSEKKPVVEEGDVTQEGDGTEASGLKYVVIFGELFGGLYPHPEVEDLGFLHIQKGVYYNNLVDFYAFDIFVELKNGKGYWYNYMDSMELFEKFHLFYAKPLFVGSLHECLKFNYAIDSTIPPLLGLPALEKNQMEGVIVKSANPVLFKKGNMSARAIYKLKNERFEEVNPKVGPSKYDLAKQEREQAVETIYEEIPRYINENRLNSVRSKIGPITGDNSDVACEALHKDIMGDFCDDFEKLLLLLDNATKDRISVNTRSKVNTFVSEYLRKQ